MVKNWTQYKLEALIFTAEWCDPCFDFVPSMNRILHSTGEFDRTYTVYSHNDPELCSYYSVQGFPSVVFRLRPDKLPQRTLEVPNSRIVGVCDHDRLKKIVDTVIKYKHACNKI